MVERRINMLQIVNGLAIGGGELKLLELARSLDKKKFNITVCSVGQGGPLKGDFEKLGIKVFVIQKLHKYDFTQIFKIVKIMRQERIDIVQTTLLYADIIGAYAAALARVPVVISWEVVSGFYGLKHILAYRLALKKIDRIVTVSNAIREIMIQERKVNPEKIQTIHYGIDTGKFRPDKKRQLQLKRELGIKDHDIVLGSVARLAIEKGHVYIVEAAEKIVEAHPRVKFVFVGDGPLYSDLVAKIRSKNLQDHFLFLGFRKDIPDLLGIFDVFILASLFEGFSNAVLEAMASSKPVIATAMWGTLESVVDNVTGYLVRPQDPAAIAEKVISLLDNPAQIRQMGEEGRKRVDRYFSLDVQLSQFEKLYDDCIRMKLTHCMP